ncbi:alpha-E domain-containing protein, partial [Rubellimicrobium rubrum]
MARHLERAENTARLVSVHSETRLDRPDRPGFYWEPALRVTGNLPEFQRRGLAQTEREATNVLITDPANPSSVLGTLARARENIRILRDVLPRESWEAINALHALASRPGAAAPQRRDAHLREIITHAQAMAGLFLGSMNEDAGYAFLRLGRAVERGDFVTRVLLDSLSGSEDNAAEWIGVLKSLTAYQMYRRSVGGPVTRPGVVRFLACSTVFPRALACCVQEAERALARLPDGTAMTELTAKLFAILAANSAVGDERRLASILRLGQEELDTLHGALVDAYFAPPLTEPSPLQGQKQSA